MSRIMTARGRKITRNPITQPPVHSQWYLFNDICLLLFMIKLRTLLKIFLNAFSMKNPSNKAITRYNIFFYFWFRIKKLLLKYHLEFPVLEYVPFHPRLSKLLTVLKRIFTYIIIFKTFKHINLKKSEVVKLNAVISLDFVTFNEIIYCLFFSF
mgnify:CR=1 FL=1